jgi:hypothetical protein
MKLGRVVDWERDVLAAWKRSANNAPRPNSDVWGKLPQGVCWLEGRIEYDDIDRLYVLGSSDWKEVFGSYRVVEIASKEFGIDDKHKHRSRICAIGDAYSIGKLFEPIAMVAFSGAGPFMVIDGNHRVVAMERRRLLVGQSVFLGLHREIGTSFGWFNNAVREG